MTRLEARQYAASVSSDPSCKHGPLGRSPGLPAWRLGRSQRLDSLAGSASRGPDERHGQPRTAARRRHEGSGERAVATAAGRSGARGILARWASGFRIPEREKSCLHTRVWTWTSARELERRAKLGEGPEGGARAFISRGLSGVIRHQTYARMIISLKGESSAESIADARSEDAADAIH